MRRRGPAGAESSDRLTIDLDGVATEATVIRSARRHRTIAISVEARNVRIRVPLRASMGQIEEAVRKHSAWVRSRLAEPRAEAHTRQFLSGERVPFRGDYLTLCVRPSEVRRVTTRVEGGSLVIDLPATIPLNERATVIQSEMTGWYRQRATEVLAGIAGHWSKVSGLVPAKVLVRDQRRRWGSCAPDGTLRFNWRLILVEPALAEYVVVHELAHLRHRNHQAEFWAEVAHLMPDHLARRKRLTSVGRTLLL